MPKIKADGLYSIRIKNFKKHKSLNVELNGQNSLITGANYSGKSTTLQAVTYALYGPASVPGGSKLVASNGGGAVSVEVDFQVSGDMYHIRRTARTCTLKRGGTKVATGSASVTEAISDLLGPIKLFEYLHLSKSREAAALTSMGLAELTKMINALTGIEEFTEKGDKLKADARDLKQQVAGIEELLVEPPRPEGDLESINNLLSAAEHMAAKDLSEYDKALVELGTLKSLQAQHESVAAQVTKAQSDVTSLKSQLAAIPSELPTEEQLEVDIWKSQVNSEDLLGKISSLKLTKQRKEQLQRTLADANAIKASIADEDLASADDTEWQTYHEQLKQANFENKERINHLTSMLDGSVCQSCNRPFDNVTETDLQSAKSELATLQSEQQQVLKGLEEADAALRQYRDHNQQAAVNQQRLATANASAASAAEELDAIPEMFSIESMEDKQLQVMSKGQDMKDLLATVRKKNTLTDKLASAEKLLQSQTLSTGPTAEQISAATVTVAETKEVKQKSSLQVEDLKGKISTHEAALLNYGVYEESLHRLQKKQTEVLRMDELLNEVVKTKQEVSSEVWQSVVSISCEFASSCTNGDISAVSYEGGVLSYHEDGKVLPIHGASGAQSAILGLSLKVALTEMFGGSLPVLMLDEPTADCRDEVSHRVMQELTNRGFQVVAISHREMDAVNFPVQIEL